MSRWPPLEPTWGAPKQRRSLPKSDHRQSAPGLWLENHYDRLREAGMLTVGEMAERLSVSEVLSKHGAERVCCKASPGMTKASICLSHQVPLPPPNVKDENYPHAANFLKLKCYRLVRMRCSMNHSPSLEELDKGLQFYDSGAFGHSRKIAPVLFAVTIAKKEDISGYYPRVLFRATAVRSIGDFLWPSFG